MNTIIADKDKFLSLKNKTVFIEIKVPELILEIDGKVTIDEIKLGQENLFLTINIAKNAELLYNKFAIVNGGNFSLNIVMAENSKCEFHYSILALNEYQVQVTNEFDGDNINSCLTIHGVTEQSGQISIIGDANILTKQKGNEFSENLNILMLNDKESKIVPNLNVESNEIVANHGATIGGLDKKTLQYLKSKGISEEKATILIKEGFLINNLRTSKEVVTKLHELLINRR